VEAARAAGDAAKVTGKKITAALRMALQMRTNHPIKSWKGTENARTFLVPRGPREYQYSD
jgi:hypothetical protein